MCFVLGVCCASPVPFRKDHLNNCVRACLSTRTENGEVDWSRGVSQDRGCLNLAQLESACVAAGRSLLSVVGQNRPNKLHQGTTASNVLMQVSKPDLSKLTKVEPSLKRTLLGSALVKDPSRSKVEEHAAEEAEPLNFHVMSHEFLPPGF